MFDISPTEEVGDFEVKAKFMGVEMEKVQLHFQVNALFLSVDSEGVERIPLGFCTTVSRRVILLEIADKNAVE